MRSRMLSATPRAIAPMLATKTQRHKYIIFCAFVSLWLILDQAPFALGAADGASKNPQREGKQHDQKSEQYK